MRHDLARIPGVGLLTLVGLTVAVIGCEQFAGSQPSVQVDSSLLTGIKDRILASDSAGYSEVLRPTHVPTIALERAGATVPYADLMAHPDQYRGKPIALQGLLWRLYELPVAYDAEFEHLYEAWIVTDESQFYRVVCSQLPADLEPGHKLRNVRVVGYFFVLEGHETPEDRVVAPTLLARRIVSTGNADLKSNFRVHFPVREPNSECNFLPDVMVGLRSDNDGNLTQLTVLGQNHGNDDKAFRRVNYEILKLIGRSRNPLVKGLTAVIDADFECQHKFVAKALASCASGEDGAPYIEKFRFAPPRDPKK